MVGPPAAARAVTTHPASALALSAALALATIWSAIALSYLTNWPIGFFVGTLAAACYLLARALAALTRRRLLPAARVPATLTRRRGRSTAYPAASSAPPHASREL